MEIVSVMAAQEAVKEITTMCDWRDICPNLYDPHRDLTSGRFAAAVDSKYDSH